MRDPDLHQALAGITAAPGLAVGALLHGELVLEHYAGFADVASARPVTSATSFCLASTTKPLVGVALSTLAHAGAIDLDSARALDDRISPLPGGRAPTVREVAAHTAGLPTFARFRYPATRSLPGAAGYAGCVTEPGDRWNYSNLGYGILGELMGVAAGKGLSDVLDEICLGGGSDLRVGTGDHEGAATRYAGSGVVYPAYDTVHAGASDAWCSLPTLLRFGQRLVDGHRGVPIAGALEVLADWDAASGYATGFVVRRFEGSAIYLHAGNMGGVGAHLIVVPDKAIVVAALANGEDGSAVAAANAVAGALLPGWAPGQPPGPGRDNADADDRPVEQVAGRWRGAWRPVGGAARDIAVDLASTPTVSIDGTVMDLAGLAVSSRGVGGMLGEEISAPDLEARPWVGVLDLRRYGERLVGQLTAFGGQDAEHPYVPDAISWPVELRRG